MELHTVEGGTSEGLECSFALLLIENVLYVVFHCQRGSIQVEGRNFMWLRAKNLM